MSVSLSRPNGQTYSREFRHVGQVEGYLGQVLRSRSRSRSRSKVKGQRSRSPGQIKVKGQFSSYDFMEVHVPLGSDSIRLVVVHHPPYNSESNPVPDSTFLREFATHMEKLVPSTGYLIITGDFNIHVNLLDIPFDMLSDSKKEYKRTAEKFVDILDSMGLKQHIHGPTHRSGNTLDLLITRTSDGALHGLPCIDAMLSDHCTLLFKVQIRKPPPVLKKVAYRLLKDIDLNAFFFV